MGNRFNRIVIVLTMLIGVSVPGALRAGAQELVMDFSAPRNVSNAQGVSQAADIALDPGGGIYLVWEDRSVELALFSHSLDGGTTFAEPVALVPGFEDYSYGQSRVASSHPGEVGVVFTIYDVHYGGAEIAYTGSSDGGNSFSQPIVISESDAFNSIVPNIATGWATAIVWYDTNLETGETAIRYTQSVDGGNAFMAPRRLDGSQGQVGCADVALGGEGSVYVAWLQNNDPFGAEDDWEVFFTRSDDHGVTFSAPVNISRYPQKSWCPRMAVDGAGTVYLVWAEGSYWTDMKPLFTRSDDGGGSFTEPRALVGPLLSHEPAIAASGAGNVWISWLTGDPTDRLYGFVTRSTDSGVNFSPAVPLPGGVEIASVESDVVHVVWNEVPQGESWADIFYSRGIVSQWGDAEMPATVVRDDDDDTITLALGDYIVDGGGGIDTLVLPLFPNVYQFTKIGANQYTAQYLDYTLSIDNVEYVQFGAEFQTRLPIAALRDGTVQGQLTRLTDLYLAFFGRAPDVSGLEYWQKRHLEEGRDTTLISMDFSWSKEARALFPLGESNRNFVKTVYQNCFGRDPDPDGWDYWTNKLNQLDPQAPEYLNDRGAFVGELLLGAYAETSGVEDRSLLINRHEVALAYVNRLSMQPAEGFDASINDLLAMVGMDYSTRYNAEHVIDHVFANAVSLTDVMSNQGLLTTLWTHDPSLDVDDDGDGWTEIQGDCKDSATAIYPGAVETCGDGIDQDCNGVDQRCPADMDDDGDGWSENQGDCNDNNSASHPGAVETCGDGIDQNCDGTDPFCDFPIDPFDPQNYMPFDQGRMWTYRGSATKSGWATIYYDNILSVVGEKMIDGVKTTVFHETNPENFGAPEDSYLYKDAHGIRYFGSDPADTLIDQLIPYQEVPFPIKAGESFVQIDKSGLDSGEDLDGDSVNEMVNIRSRLTVVGFSTQTVPAGTFSNSAELKTDVTMNIRLSRSKSWVTATGVNHSWYAPGTGRIKTTSLYTQDGYSEIITEELTGYYSLLAADISPGNSDSESPGKPGVGYDGTNYLVVSRRDVSPLYSVIIGIIVNADGRVLKRFDITAEDTGWVQLSSRLDVAFDGHNYLVVFSRNGQLTGIRVTPAGQVLDGPAGFVIADSGSNGFPAVDFDGTNFLVAWAKYQNDYDIYGALVSPEGQVQAEFPVFTAAGEQIAPTIAFNGHNYLVAWGDSRWDGTTSVVDIYATRVSPAGVPLDPAGIPLCTAAGDQGEPDLTSDGSNYFAVWADGRDYASQSGQIPNLDIYGARITPAGSILDPGGLPINTVNYLVFNGKANPTVAFDGTDYFVSWQTGSSNIYPPAGIFANWITRSGVVENPSVGEDGLSVSGSPTTYARYVYPVAGSGAGRVFLAWVNQIEVSGESKDLYGKVVTHK